MWDVKGATFARLLHDWRKVDMDSVGGFTMPKTLTELDKELDALAATLSALTEQEGPVSHIGKITSISDNILEATPPEHRDHVWSRLQCIQRDAGLIPGDDEPCAEA